MISPEVRGPYFETRLIEVSRCFYAMQQMNSHVCSLATSFGVEGWRGKMTSPVNEPARCSPL